MASADRGHYRNGSTGTRNRTCTHNMYIRSQDEKGGNETRVGVVASVRTFLVLKTKTCFILV